jgi:hypothetical protein
MDKEINARSEEISLKEVLLKLKSAVKYLKSKFFAV